MAWRRSSPANTSSSDIVEYLLGKASTQYVSGGMVKMSAGLPVALTGQTDTPFGIVQVMNIQPYNGQNEGNVNGINASPLRPATPLLTTTVGEQIGIIPTPGSIFDCDVTPLLNRVAAAANTNKAQAICVYGGSTSDLNGGYVYLPEQDWQAIITTSAVSAGSVTIVFAPAAPRACTTGDTVSALPFSIGFSVKWDAINFDTQVSNAVADNTNGNALIREVHMENGNPRGSSAVVSCQIKSPI